MAKKPKKRGANDLTDRNENHLEREIATLKQFTEKRIAELEASVSQLQEQMARVLTQP